VWFGLPSDPAESYFLNAEEKELMRIRYAQRKAYMGSEDFDWNEVKNAFRDPKLYIRCDTHVNVRMLQPLLTVGTAVVFSSVRTSSSTASALSCPPSSKAWATILSRQTT